MTASDPKRTEWTVPCADTFGRERALHIRAEAGAVIVGFPPGEAAQLDMGQFAVFRSAMLAAGYRAGQQAGHTSTCGGAR